MTKALTTIAVAWHDRRRVLADIRERAISLQPLVLLFLVVAVIAIVEARVVLYRDMQQEAERTAAAEAMMQEQQRQEAVRASVLAAERAEAEAAAEAHRADCEAVARVLYGTARHHSEEAQKAVVWCIVNRVESSLYPNTVQEVCEQESQWMGYSPENPIVESLYQIADEVISGWEAGGYRAISPDYLFLTWTRDEIILRTTFTDGANTHYWRVG